MTTVRRYVDAGGLIGIEMGAIKLDTVAKLRASGRSPTTHLQRTPAVEQRIDANPAIAAAAIGLQRWLPCAELSISW